MADKSLYEMTQEELNEYAPQDFNEAVIKEHAPLVEQWRKTPWFASNVNPKIPGATQAERDLNEATYARIFQNYVDDAFVGREKGRAGHRQSIDVADAMKLMEQHAPHDNALLNRTLTEAATVAQTSAWSGATLLPMVLGMVRKLLPRLNALQFYQVQALDRPTGRVFFLARNRETNGTTDGQVEQRAGWSYRSWAASPGENQTIVNAVSFTITSSDVSTFSQKLAAKTTFEVERDLRAYFGMDAVALVSDIAADELATEQNEILLRNLYSRAVANGVGQYQYGHLTVPSGHTVESWDKRLLEIINRAKMGVYTRKLVVPNYMIGGTEWETRLSNLGAWTASQNAVNFNQAGNLAINGSVNGMPVGTAIFPFPTLEAILGYKGTSWIDSNAFYLPYQPVQLYAIFPNPDTMVRTLSWSSTYAIHNNVFSGEKESYAWLTMSTGISNLSYPADVEYSG